VWGYDASEPADVGRLFVADNVVTHVKSDVWTWDWSAMLPVLESVQVLFLLLLLLLLFLFLFFFFPCT
jgi:hypothetical protein